MFVFTEEVNFSVMIKRESAVCHEIPKDLAEISRC